MRRRHTGHVQFLHLQLTRVDSDVSDELAGLFESLPAVMAAVGEATPIDAFLVVSRTGGERPARRAKTKSQSNQATKLLIIATECFIVTMAMYAASLDYRHLHFVST